MQRRRIRLSPPEIGAELSDACAEIHLRLRGEQRTISVEQFEALFSRILEWPAVGLQSGTAALHLALKAIGIRQDDEVVVPTFSFAACCHATSYERAVPVFLDSEPRTWNLDAELLQKFLRKRARTNRLPKAVIVVHNYGQCAELEWICEICERYEVVLIEDAAEAIGAMYQGKTPGTFGDLGVFSFNCNKIVTGLGGGALVSRRSDWIDKARYWSSQSKKLGPDYIHCELGYNYRMNPISAALILRQFPFLEERVAGRRAVFDRYQKAFEGVEGIEGQTEVKWGSEREGESEGHSRHTRWLSCFLIDEKKFGMGAADLIRYLDAGNVESRSVWKPMHTQPLYRKYECLGGAIAEDLNRCGICLPSSSSLSESDQEFVIEAVRRAHVGGRE